MSAIFISHSSKDSAVAEEISHWLAERGYGSVFLDFDPAQGIPAGRDWEQELYRTIGACRAVIVLCSEHSMASRWTFMEITHARALGKPIFPLKIDHCDTDGVLTDRQVIDLTENKEEGLQRLWRGLLGVGLDPADAFDWDGSRSPYPGLLAFQEEDAAIFFGRDDEIGEGLDLLNKVRRLGRTRLVMVLGASGMGKSSLVRAGLMPRLRRDMERWLVIDPFRPRDDPARELAMALSRAFDRVGRTLHWERIYARLQEAMEHMQNDILGELADDLRRRSMRDEAKVLLLIDQFEELLGHEPDHPNSRFLQLLRRSLDRRGSPLLALGTMRSDFLGQFQKSPALLDMRYESLSLGPMSPGDMAQAIEKPAQLATIELEPGLVQAMLADAGTGDTLPLLAFTLRELNERYGDDGLLELHEYRVRLGGLQGAMARVADEIFASESLGGEEEALLRAAFLAMVQVTEDGTYVRRAVHWDELPLAVHPSLERFVQSRLLVARSDARGRTLEVAHEALFRSWGRLKYWLGESAEALRLRHEIQLASQSWEVNSRDEDQGQDVPLAPVPEPEATKAKKPPEEETISPEEDYTMELDLTEQLTLAFRLALDQRKPELLLPSDAGKIGKAVRAAVPDAKDTAALRKRLTALEKKQGNTSPHPLWLAWMKAGHNGAHEPPDETPQS